MDAASQQFQRFAQQGDLEALGKVFDQVAPQLLSLAKQRCRHAADAEDTVQATFLVAIRKALSFDASQPVMPWLIGILHGEIRNLQRRETHRRHAQETDIASPADDPALIAADREATAQLHARVERLPVEQRQVVAMHLHGTHTTTRIGKDLQIAPGTVRMRLHRGLQRLRRMLPVGMALTIWGSLSSRGLAAVRQTVLDAAGRAPYRSALEPTTPPPIGWTAKWWLVGALALCVAVGYSMTAATPVGAADAAAEQPLVPTGDADLDELRRLAVKAPIDELMNVAVAFVGNLHDLYPNDKVLWGGIDRICGALIAGHSVPDRRPLAGFIAQLIEKGDPSNTKPVLHHVPGLRRIK